MKVWSNTAVSLDGRIATARYDHVAIGSKTDRRYMSVLRARADAVLVGGKTFRNWPHAMVPDPRALAQLRTDQFFDCETPALEGRQWWNVVVSRQGVDIPSHPLVKPLVLAGAVPDILAELSARGVETLLLECGGDLLSQFLAAGAVDEIYTTICPLVLGGKGAPTLCDGEGFSFAGAPRLELRHARQVGDELYCRWGVRCLPAASLLAALP